ncbi:MAG: Crp/Fnr family transcriptional regulator [Cytophagales bacterium]|nr:Crp/Fnr family transcriptional regulator [Cytophagales bacterium]
MSSRSGSLLQRQRPPNDADLAAIPWLALLAPADYDYVLPEIKVTLAQEGDVICRIGRPVTYWFGVVEGLLKMSSDSADGKTMTFVGVSTGGWFGEGTALKREPYRYNISALRDSVVAGISIEAFHWLLDHSIAFNKYLMRQLNERLSQFIAAREVDRISNPEHRVARTLAGLLNPTLYPQTGNTLTITQQELAYLVGLSRQRVNVALKALEAQGTIRLQYGGLTVPDIQKLT